MPPSRQTLIDAAIAVRRLAYAPYSNFAVGAAVLATKSHDVNAKSENEELDQQIFTGCNCENAVYGLSICAERVAITQAVSAGYRQIDGVAIAASPLATPCGPCRQFMIEFNEKLEVIAVDADDSRLFKRWNIRQLLPNHFSLSRPG